MEDMSNMKVVYSLVQGGALVLLLVSGWTEGVRCTAWPSLHVVARLHLLFSISLFCDQNQGFIGHV
eukprot:scaffold183623_cov15-Tisochrysis_lutea.AAC.1